MTLSHMEEATDRGALKTTQARLVVAGTAQWGRQVRVRSDLSAVCYEADLMAELHLGGSDAAPHYFSMLLIGMDDVQEDGAVPKGFGRAALHDLSSGAVIYGRVDWFMQDGKDKGRVIFEWGTGRWAGVTADIPVTLEWAPVKPGTEVTGGDPVAVMGFFQGTGRLSYTDENQEKR